MSQIEEYEALLERVAPKPLCDDCSAEKLGFSQRQTANQFSRALAATSNFYRRRDICYSCRDQKLVTSTTSSKNKKTSAPSSSEQEVTRKPLVDLSQLKHLTAIGCVRVGSWEQSGGEIKLNLKIMQTMNPALYAFVSNGKILYVGKTTQALSKRLYYYAKPGPTQSTNIRVNKLLKALSAKGTSIDIFALGNGQASKVGIFKVNLPAALEDDVIRQFKPMWNVRK